MDSIPFQTDKTGSWMNATMHICIVPVYLLVTCFKSKQNQILYISHFKSVARSTLNYSKNCSVVKKRSKWIVLRNLIFGLLWHFFHLGGGLFVCLGFGVFVLFCCGFFERKRERETALSGNNRILKNSTIFIMNAKGIRKGGWYSRN